MANAKQIAEFLDGYLGTAGFADSSNNGLQVGSDSPVKRIMCGVDASMETFEIAVRQGAGLLVCHHGISWGDSLKRITGNTYRRIGFLVKNNLALYACHLPLDAHPVCGNNILICRALGLKKLRRFGFYHDIQLGYAGELPAPLPVDRFVELVRSRIGARVELMRFGKKTIRSVAVVSGSPGGAALDEAARKGFDVFLAGDLGLDEYHLAKENGIHAIFAGHYATEIFGVRSLANLLKKRFKISCECPDLQTPY